MVLLPGAKGNGEPSPRTVELLDIYPTLADLCGLPAPANLAGKSLRPLLGNPKAGWAAPAFTQVLHGKNTGRSVHAERWRYTEWNGGRDGSELYDHDADPQEWHNLTNDPGCSKNVEELKNLLKNNFKPSSRQKQTQRI